MNQHFGDNIPCVQNFGLPNQLIVSGRDNVTCPSGFDKLYSHFGMSGHNGTDLQAGEQNCNAALEGQVIEKQIVPARGFGVGVLSNIQYDLGEFGTHFLKLRYWHFKSFNVEVGDSVDVGHLLGVTNSTGYSGGNHLHFEGQPMDKDAGGHPMLLQLPGMIANAIDIEPFFIGQFADTIPQQITLNKRLIPVLQAMIELLKKKN